MTMPRFPGIPVKDNPSGGRFGGIPVDDRARGSIADQGDQNDSGFWSDLGNEASYLGRKALSGALAIPEMVHDNLVAAPVNAVSEAVGSDYRIAPAQQQLDYALNAAGLPGVEPETELGRIGGDIAQGAGSAIGGIGLGKALLKYGTEGAQALGSLFAEKPVAQIASASLGSGGAGLAREADMSPGAQMVAGLVSGMAPGVASTTLSEALRRAARGGEAGRQRMASNAAAFESVGASPTVGQASQGRLVQGLESALSRVPGGAGVMARAAERQAEDTAGGVNAIASKLSSVSDPERVGRMIERGVTGKGGFTDRFKQHSRDLYNKLDDFIPGDRRIDVRNVMRVLPDLNPTIPGAPETSRFFQNARIRGIEGALRSDAEGSGSALTRPEVQRKAEQLQDALRRNNAVVDATNAAGREAVDQANLVRAGTPRQSFEPVPPLSEGEIQSAIREMAQNMADGKLPYEAVKKLRTLVGTELENNTIASDVPRSKWSALYAALSDDLGQAAEATGPQARQAWNRANTYYRAGRERLDRLANVIDKNGGPEAVFNAATSGTRDGATTLRSVMQSLKPEEQKALASVMVRRLGRATPGQQNAAGDVFSMGTFLTNWNRLSPEARKALFGRFGDQFAKDMDGIARVAENVRAGSKVFSNPSGTAAAMTNIGTWGAALGAIASGNVAGAAYGAAGLGTINLASRLMTNPRFVHWLAKQTKNGIPPQTANLANLYNMAKTHDDPDLARAADALASQRQRTTE